MREYWSHPEPEDGCGEHTLALEDDEEDAAAAGAAGT